MIGIYVHGRGEWLRALPVVTTLRHRVEEVTMLFAGMNRMS